MDEEQMREAQTIALVGVMSGKSRDEINSELCAAGLTPQEASCLVAAVVAATDADRAAKVGIGIHESLMTTEATSHSTTMTSFDQQVLQAVYNYQDKVGDTPPSTARAQLFSELRINSSVDHNRLLDALRTIAEQSLKSELQRPGFDAALKSLLRETLADSKRKLLVRDVVFRVVVPLLVLAIILVLLLVFM